MAKAPAIDNQTCFLFHSTFLPFSLPFPGSWSYKSSRSGSVLGIVQTINR